jgi:hypothetical protein
MEKSDKIMIATILAILTAGILQGSNIPFYGEEGSLFGNGKNLNWRAISMLKCNTLRGSIGL